MKIGSPDFLKQWHLFIQEDSRQWIIWLMELLDFPEDLSGEVDEINRLLSVFDDQLSPQHYFWRSLAKQVDNTFPESSLSEELSQEAAFIHQLRYVISCQQAQWVRDHYREEGQSDAEALSAYLRTLKGPSFWHPFRKADYTLSESARLHNKVLLDGDLILPVNIKIVVHFSTEFILSASGEFVNELDPEGQTLNGVINGASFNYASRNDARHRALDVQPIRYYDPAFRRRMMTFQGSAFRAPVYTPYLLRWFRRELWKKSYLNPRGDYAVSGKSRYKVVRMEQKRFKKML